MLTGIIAISILLLMVFLGMPIVIALLLVGISGIIYLVGWDVTVGSIGALVVSSLAKYGYSVIPMFILLGQIGYYSGLLTEIFEVARRWVGRLRGGLAIGVVAANAIFAACSGSSVAACVVVGRAAIPVMKKAGYSDALSTGAVAASGTLSSLIPPSVAICIYGLLVDESIGKLLIGGFIPGAVSAAIYILFIMARSRGIPIAEGRFTWRSRLYSIRYLWVPAVLIIAIMGGIYLGVCTPTEGGAVGAFVMLLLGLATRRMNWRIIQESVKGTVVTTGMILIIIVSAIVFSRFLVLSGFNRGVSEFVAATAQPRVVIFLLVTLVYFVLGCFVGATGMMVMTVPIFYPLMLSLGFDSIWFGIIVVKYCEMAYITPPVGVNLYMVKSVAPGVPLVTIIRGAAPFLIMDLLTIGVFYLFPELITFLPSIM